MKKLIFIAFFALACIGHQTVQATPLPLNPVVKGIPGSIWYGYFDYDLDGETVRITVELEQTDIGSPFCTINSVGMSGYPVTSYSYFTASIYTQINPYTMAVNNLVVNYNKNGIDYSFTYSGGLENDY